MNTKNTTMTDLTMSQFASKDDLIAAQAARIAELEADLEAVGAGGVQRFAIATQECSRSHPHEEMTPMCELRTEIARMTNALACAEAQQAAPDERAAFEAWLGIKPCGAAHDLAWSSWKARAALAATQPAPQGLEQDAARYRYLRETDRYFSDDKDGAIYVRQVGITSGVITGSTILTDEELDAAIDRACAAQAKQGGA